MASSDAYVFRARLVGWRGVTRTIAVRGGYACEYTTPGWAEDGWRTANVRVQTLGLAVGQKVAYLFDFGDEWRVMLTLTKILRADDGPYPQILASRGEAPPSTRTTRRSWTRSPDARSSALACGRDDRERGGRAALSGRPPRERPCRGRASLGRGLARDARD